MSNRLDKSRFQRAFNQAARTYDEVAVLQRHVGEELLSRLSLVRLQPKTILDIGSGTGHFAIKLAARYKDARIISIDIAPDMLKQGRQKLSWMQRRLGRQHQFICADAESIPLATHSVDLVFSNLTLQWCEPPDQAFTEIRRVLAPNGLMHFSTLGPDTLKELRASWRAADTHDHVHHFMDMHDVGDALIRAQLAEPIMDVETITLTYANTIDLMRDLKTLGAHNASSQRQKGLTTARQLDLVKEHYERYRVDGLLPASYEVVYGHAWASALKNQRAIPVELTPP